MIVGRELRAWIENREGQRLTRLAAQALTDRWAEGPVHLAFARATAAIPARTAEAIGEACARCSPTMTGSTSSSTRSPKRCAEIPISIHLPPPQQRAAQAAWWLRRRSGVGCRGRVQPHPAGRQEERAAPGRFDLLLRRAQHQVRQVRRRPLSFWEAPRIAQDFSAANAGRCERVAERRIADGEILTVDGRHQSFIIEHAAANMIVVQAVVKADRAPVSVEYDAASGDYVGCSAADDSASRIQMITTLLRKLDCEAAVATMIGFLDHPSFFVRWHVMRDLLGIDLEAALPHLKRMSARDPHPEIRQAARATLDQIEGKMIRDRAA
jgi:hypothetical protein